MTQQLDISKIVQYPFDKKQYFEETHTKTQIYLHHTAGRSNGINTYKSWESNTERVGTCVVISGVTDAMPDGQIVQGFSSKYWAYHLGLTKDVFKKFGVPYQSLDKISIGIEICNWGYLKKTDRGFESWAQVLIPESDVCVLSKPFKGNKYYHNYTDAQIESVRQLLVYWSKRYNIPLTYNEDIFDLNKRALSGEPGIYTHNSVRKDKTDIYPHPKMVDMLKSL
jgi:N-acetyl-anhydromuramyl-L-alanine amidase AmpD